MTDPDNPILRGDMSSTSKLVHIASEPLGPAARPLSADVPVDLKPLLDLKNGFFAFGGALLVYPSKSIGRYDLENVNRAEGWKQCYSEFDLDATFFGCDVFGHQFAMKSGAVLSFDAETAAFSIMANSLDAWAGMILDDHSFWTGWRLAKAWQTANRTLRCGERLMPVVPLTLGGAFSVDNLMPVELFESLRVRAKLATMMRNLPDGTSIAWSGWPMKTLRDE